MHARFYHLHKMQVLKPLDLKNPPANRYYDPPRWEVKKLYSFDRELKYEAWRCAIDMNLILQDCDKEFGEGEESGKAWLGRIAQRLTARGYTAYEFEDKRGLLGRLLGNARPAHARAFTTGKYVDLRDDELPGTCGKWVLEKTARGEVPLGWDLNADVMRLRAWSPEHKAWLELSIQVADEPMSLLHPEDFGFLPEYTCENDDGVLMNIFCPWGVSGGEYLAPIRDSRVMNKEQLREMREKLARESAIAALDYVKATLLDDSCRSAVGMRIDRLKGFLDNTSDAEEIMERLNAPP